MERITVDPEIHFGKPCIAGTRITVQSVLELIDEGLMFGEIIEDYYPDLTVEDVKVDVKDEVGLLAQGFNEMKHSLRQLIDEVNKSSEYVASSADQLAQNAEENSRATEQITLAMQEISSGVVKNIYV